MLSDEIKKAEHMARVVGYVFVVTCDDMYQPHMCIAGRLEVVEDRCISLTEWFCPGTVANIQQNKNISVVSWDSTVDHGYQLIGKVRKSIDVGILDGYAGASEMDNIPQIEKQLLIDVEKAMAFKKQPHTDKELD